MPVLAVRRRRLEPGRRGRLDRGGEVLVDLEEVGWWRSAAVRPGGGSPRLAKSGEPAVVFGVAEDRLDQLRSLLVELGAVLGREHAAHEVIRRCWCCAGRSGTGCSIRRAARALDMARPPARPRGRARSPASQNRRAEALVGLPHHISSVERDARGLVGLGLGAWRGTLPCGQSERGTRPMVAVWRAAARSTGASYLASLSGTAGRAQSAVAGPH